MTVNEFYNIDGAKQLIERGLNDVKFIESFLAFFTFQPDGEKLLMDRINDLLLDMESETKV